ncbi:deaminase domain-containing protein [Chitinophaga sp. S165]|uniref:deaminase domain-containing protein n=1 Tax=Chitinophaga sp. S165 TaxID=2135462 RepID=UPI000D7116A1|nr:deaminase domain-containing protein [Chitinophaga sp. S165]PWV55608.1 putative deaminase of polymorphic toxin system [Chitinophaga sp. S165]
MKLAYLKLIVLFVVLSGIVHMARANSAGDSLIDKQAAAIQQRLLTRIQENQRLINEGRAEEANYIVTDDDPVYFYKHFTSSYARRFWVDRDFWRDVYGTLIDYTIDKDGISEKVKLNSWIGHLKKTYLDKTAYKDYKLYFVISGIYNYEYIDAKEPQYEWATMAPTTYTQVVNEEKKPGVDLAKKENAILNAVLKKVKQDGENKQLTTIIEKEKYIVFFLFNFYKYPYAEQIVRQGTMGMGDKITVERKRTMPQTFVINGCFYSSSIAPALIGELLKYNTDNQSGENPSRNTGDLTTRMDYFTQMIRNAFTFFSVKEGFKLSDLPCDKDKKLLKQLQDLYAHGLPNSSMSAAASLKLLPLATRTCLLEQLSKSTLCGDGDKILSLGNYCENMIVDLISSVPDEDKAGLLEFLSMDNGVLPRIINSKIHDVTPDEVAELVMTVVNKKIKLPKLGGKLNYTAVVELLCQYAYDVYQDKVIALQEASQYPCDWLLYDPNADYNPYSKNVLADYTASNNIEFKFRGNTQAYCRILDMYPTGNSYRSIDRTKKPFEFIGIIPDVDLPFEFTVNGKKEDYKGKKIIVPALLLYWNINKIKTNSAVDGLTTAFSVLHNVKEGFTFNLDETKSLKEALQKWSKNLGTFHTIVTTVTEAPAIKAEILKMEYGKEFIDLLDGIGKHSSFLEKASGKEIDIKAFRKLCDVVLYWRKCLTKPEIYTDANFASINGPLSDFDLALFNDGIISKSANDARQIVIDKMFSPVKDAQNFQAFRQFYINDPMTTVDLTDDKWVAQVSNWQSKDGYNISSERNMARVIYSWKEFLIAEDKQKYNDQMTVSNKFIPESFYDLLNSGKRMFDPKITLRRFDTDLVALEYFANHYGAVKGSKNNVTDEITIYTDLIPCRSCTYVLAQFREMFPNVKLHIITSMKLHP